MNKSHDQQRFIKFYDDHASKFDLGYAGHPQIIEKVNQKINIIHESRVLDVGCGTGNDTVLFRRYSPSLTVGCDISTGQLGMAKKKDDSILWLRADAELLPFPNAFFSIVYSCFVLLFLPTPKQFFEQAFRLLVDGGGLFIVTTSHQQIRERIENVFFPRLAEVELNRWPDVPEILEWFRVYGFSKIETEVVEFAPRQLDVSQLNLFRQRDCFSSFILLSDEEMKQGCDALQTYLDQGKILSYTPKRTLIYGYKSHS